jgi:hypothetical protein
MASQQDAQKRQAWEVRLGRFRRGGLTVARFCEQEGVSANTFYYWAKRVGSTSISEGTAETDGISGRGRHPREHMHATGQEANVALVRFRWGASVEVSVPADCLDAIRCLAASLPHTRTGRGDAFQEVVVSC